MTIRHQRILVPLDGSTLASEALPHAQALATANDAELILLRVAPDAAALGEVLDNSRNIMHIEDREQAFLDEATRWIENLAEELRLQRFHVKTSVTVGPPAARIIDYAQKNGVDLIVMSTHGRTGLARWVYGSVADKVLRAAPCPVYLVQSSIKKSK